MKNNIVVILCPMDSECSSLMSRVENKVTKHIGGYIFCEGRINGVDVVVIRCLIGTVNAAVCTALAIERYMPKCVIIQGTAGAHNPELSQYDIVVGKRAVALMNIVSPRKKAGEGTNPFEWEDFGVQSYSLRDDTIDFLNSFECDRELYDLALTVPYSHGRVTGGVIGCLDAWNRETDLILYYRKEKGTDCEAMEGVAVAQVCAAFDVPMIEIRVISNSELRDDQRFKEDTAVCGQEFIMDFLKKLRETM